MKKKQQLLFVCLTLLLVNQAQAQEPKLTIGPGYKSPKREFIANIVGNKEGEYYIVKGRGRAFSLKTTMYLERYTNDMERTFSKIITVSNTNKKRLNYEGIACMDTAPILFSSYFNKEKHTKYAFANEINSEGEVSRQFHVVDKIQDLKKDRLGDFQFFASNDTSKLLVYKYLYKKSKENVELLFKVYSKSMDLLWQQELTLPYVRKAVRVIRVHVDNAGNVFMLAAVADEALVDNKTGKRKKAGLFKKVNNTYKIFAISPTGGFKEFNVSLGEQFISDITMDINPKGQMICAGYYGNKDAASMNGLFYLIVDPDSQQILHKNVKELDKAILEKLESKRKAAKKKGLAFMDLSNLLFTEDGRTIMVGEQHFLIITVTRDKNGNTHTRYDYYYNSILVTSINADGTIGWTTIVPKRQHSVNDGASHLGYSKIAVGNNLHFVYNDTKKNMTLEEPKKLQEARAQYFWLRLFAAKTYPAIATIGKEGNLTRALLVPPDTKLKAMMSPKFNLQVSDRELLVSFCKSNLIKFGKVSF